MSTYEDNEPEERSFLFVSDVEVIDLDNKRWFQKFKKLALHVPVAKESIDNAMQDTKDMMEN